LLASQSFKQKVGKFSLWGKLKKQTIAPYKNKKPGDNFRYRRHMGNYFL
jgi:hypothetical protein